MSEHIYNEDGTHYPDEVYSRWLDYLEDGPVGEAIMRIWRLNAKLPVAERSDLALAHIEHQHEQESQDDAEERHGYGLEQADARRMNGLYLLVSLQIREGMDCVDLDLVSEILDYFPYDAEHYATDWGAYPAKGEMEHKLRERFYLNLLDYLIKTSKPVPQKKPLDPDQILYPPAD